MPSTYTVVLDFTYDGKKVFALEMGDFFTSSLKGSERLRSAKNLPSLHDEYDHALKKKYPDAIYVKDVSVYTKSHPFYSLMLYDFFTNQQTKCNFADERLLSHFLYNRVILGKRFAYERPLLMNFKSTIIPTELRAPIALYQTQQRNKFDVLNYKGVLFDACQDKVIFNQFAQDTNLCPSTLLVNLHIVDLNEILLFLRDNPSSHYVIKPTDLSMGRGVEILTPPQLIQTIKTLQNTAREVAETLAINPQAVFNASEDLPNAIWRMNFHERENPFLIIQTLHVTKAISYESHTYRPTGRAVIQAIFDEDNQSLTSLDFLGSYWKFPMVDDSNFTTDSLVSFVNATSPVADIAPEDWADIERQLRASLPLILLKLFFTEFEDLGHYFQANANLQHYYQWKIMAYHSPWNIPRKPESCSDMLSFFDELTCPETTEDIKGFREDLSHFAKCISFPNANMAKDLISKPKVLEEKKYPGFFKAGIDNKTGEHKDAVTINTGLNRIPNRLKDTKEKSKKLLSSKACSLM